PKKLDLSYSGLDEFKEPEFKGYGPENSKQESNIVCDRNSNDSKENSNNSLVKEQVSKDTSSFVESSFNIDKEPIFPVDKKVESVKPKNHENLVKKSVRYFLIIPRKDRMYIDMKNIVPKETLTCLVAKATSDESMLWHRRLGHINFKNINKLVKDNLVRGLPTNRFENDQTCIACLKGKQYRASYFIKEIENLVDKKVKIIRCDNGTKFKNKVMDEFCREKGTQGELNAGTSEGICQDCIVMPLWKDASYFDSPSKDVGNGEPKSDWRCDKDHPIKNILMDLPIGRGPLEQMVFRNKKDERGIVIRNKARQSLQGGQGTLWIASSTKSMDKYVVEILKKFNYTSASTLIDLEKPLVKDGDADDVDVHLYRSMIGSLMYLTAYMPRYYVCTTIDRKVKITVSEASIRRHLKLEDSEGIPSLPYSGISTANISVSNADASVTTASASISTVSPPIVSTAEDISGAETLVYIRRSASKEKDKGKAIMKEFKPPKKIKKRVQVQMSIDEELAKKVFKEEQARFNAEQEASSRAEQEQEKFDFETTLELQRQMSTPVFVDPEISTQVDGAQSS
ncbi:ribonuclease H-like domain-containing protein, partial [Tanacetum coccineum]